MAFIQFIRPALYESATWPKQGKLGQYEQNRANTSRLGQYKSEHAHTHTWRESEAIRFKTFNIYDSSSISLIILISVTLKLIKIQQTLDL